MMTINRQDVFKTVMILWFVLTTGYVVIDQYQGYKVRGMQAAYQQGYGDSVDQLIAQAQQNGCTPVDVHKDDKKVSLVNAQCLSQEQPQPQATQQQASQAAAKK